MSKITITEALAEIKLVDKRITAKREFLMQLLYRQDRMRDPLEKQGGSAQAITREKQAIGDLYERKVTIRRAISDANEATEVTVEGETRRITDWLVWRREVAPGKKEILASFRAQIQAARADATRKGLAVVTTGDLAQTMNDLIINVDEAALAVEIEHLEVVLAGLDGQLSLKNATILVEL